MPWLKIAAIIAISIFSVGLFYRLRLAFAGLRVTSWWRSPSKNKRVGGKANSKHLFGWAFDVTPNNPATIDKLRSIGFTKIIPEPDHVHVQI